MKQEFFDAVIYQVIDEGPATKRFFLRILHVEKFDFQPGQFVMLNLPIHSKIPYRSYSIASAPTGDNTFELLIVLKPSGVGTPYILKNFKEGTVVRVAGPLGKFILPVSIDHDLCFISTGTGIAPLRSMLHHILFGKIPHKKIYLIFGNRRIPNILYRKEMEVLEKENPEFSFIPVLSRENPETWNGKLGYVHHVYEELFADKRQAYFYICGWSAMLQEARERLKNMGYAKEFIRHERYD